MAQMFPGLDPAPLVAELRARLAEELDYRIEAAQPAAVRRLLPRPPVHPRARPSSPQCSTQRVLTTELADGRRGPSCSTWTQAERDLAAEAIFRFVFRSLYRFHAFNGDPHPGNYLFQPGGQVTFLDFGLVKRFDDRAMATLPGDDPLRGARAGPRPVPRHRRGAPGCCAPARRSPRRRSDGTSGTSTSWSEPTGSSPGRRSTRRDGAPDLRPQLPHRPHATVPADFVIIQRINLGLYAILGQLRATADYRARRRGALADGERSAFHAHGRGRGGMAGPPVTQPGGGSVAVRSIAARCSSSRRTTDSRDWRTSGLDANRGSAFSSVSVTGRSSGRRQGCRPDALAVGIGRIGVRRHH